jgi:hypothetical protein
MESTAALALYAANWIECIFSWLASKFRQLLKTLIFSNTFVFYFYRQFLVVEEDFFHREKEEPNLGWVKRVNFLIEHLSLCEPK